jgi:hypothetical protein
MVRAEFPTKQIVAVAPPFCGALERPDHNMTLKAENQPGSGQSMLVA